MRKKNVLLSELVVLLMLLGGAAAHAGSDVFSVNFYMKPWPWPDADTQHITLEDANQSAGVDDWLTDGWKDIVVPWDPAAPQDPVTITSTEGLTATFTLVTARNGGSYYWDQVRTTLLGNGNADMMDGHANSTEDSDELFEMTVSDIPFSNYDVIIYLGSQEAQFFDGKGTIVFDGVERNFTLTSGVFDGTFVEIVDATTPGNYILYEGLRDSSFTVQTWGDDFTHLGPTGFQIREANPALAADPSPANEATDVPRDVILGWSPGDYAATHDVYLGTSFDAVSDATTSSDEYRGRQAASTFTPDRLAFETTYFWRIDEVNAPPDSTVYPGEVWSFTTEPIGYPLASEHIAVTASSANADTEGPEKVIDGSGLDPNGLHSTNVMDMWRTSMTDASPWIEFAFDKPYMLHEMLVWNHNSQLELGVGFGVKEATVEYSLDGTEWATLDTVELARATGRSDYQANGVVAFGGAAAQYVRVLPINNWGGILTQYGLSEVRFLYVPVAASEPEPVEGATDVSVDATLTWEAGRQAGAHDVYLSTNEQAVIDGTALVQTVTGASYAPALDLGSTYFWRIDEVNDVETPSVWQGDLWSFSTQEYLVVDDFESYTNYSPDRVFQTWIDGLGFSPDEFYPNGSNGNGSGSLVGYDPLAGDIMETTFIHSGNQAMPVVYDNTAATYSEATRTFVPAQDWSRHGITILTVWFHGDPGNDAQQMYVKINNTKVLYSGEASVVSEPRWRQWDISLEELATQGVNLQGVTQFALGFDRIGGVGGQGVMIFDDIRLQRPVASDVPSIAIAIPNGDFEEIYKPGSDTIAADLSDGWTQGVGLDVPMDSGTAIYSDGTTGDAVDIPGWIGADAQGWIDNGGSYDRDTAFPNRQGSVARQSATPDGLYYFLSNGGGWGNAAGGLIVSEAPVATVESGLTYTLSMLANGGATPVVLELLADGVALTPSSSVDPELSGEWQEFSRTYDAATLEAHVGESLTIRLGVGRGASGGQSHFDAVSLSYPEPTVSLVENFDSLAVGANMNEVDGWEGWFGDAQWGARVSDVVAYSGTNCLEIVGNRDDLVPNWPQQTSGQWTLTVMQYCPSNVAAAGKMYFGALSQYDAATETVGWIGSVIADFGTGKAYCEEDQAVQVDLAYDTWV